MQSNSVYQLYTYKAGKGNSKYRDVSELASFYERILAEKINSRIKTEFFCDSDFIF